MSTSLFSSLLSFRTPEPSIRPPHTPPFKLFGKQSLAMPLLYGNKKNKITKIYATSGRDNMELFWVHVVKDDIMAELLVAYRRLASALAANKLRHTAVMKLGEEVAEKDPMWPDLCDEADSAEFIELMFVSLFGIYVKKRKPLNQSKERFMETTMKTFQAMDDAKTGRLRSKVVIKWASKYGKNKEKQEDWHEMIKLSLWNEWLRGKIWEEGDEGLESSS